MHVYALAGEAARQAQAAAAIARDTAAAAADDVDRRGRFPSESVEALGRAGLLGLCVSRDQGGLGQGPRAFVGVVEELAQACGSTAMIFVMHVCAQQAVAASETLAGRDALLGQIAAGRHLSTLALSEQGSRSQFWVPVSGLTPDGTEGFVTTARKSWVTAAGHAQSMVSSAGTPGAQSGLDSTLYLARPGAKGLKVAGSFDGLGLRGNDSAPVAIEGLRLAKGDLITAPGGGAKVILEVILPWFALGTGAMANGLCRAAVTVTASHLQQTTFQHTGQALRDLPQLRARLARMSVRTEQSRALLRQAVDLVEQPSEATPLFVLQARLAAIEAAVEVTDLAMKTCGGAAFSRHLPLERLFRDARAGWVMAPTVDHLEDFIGKALTGLPLF